MKNTITGMDIITRIMLSVHDGQNNLRAQAEAAAASELGFGRMPGSEVTLFSDSSGNYAEMLLMGDRDCACGMKLRCIVDTDTMQVCGVSPETSL